MMKAITTALGSLALLAGCAPSTWQEPMVPSAVAPEEGAVSSADPRATAAGEAILARGGSATDAAIAVMLALTVVEPQSSGIGGGGFLVRGDSDGDVTSYDGRETAPAAATPTRFLDPEGEVLPRDIRVTSGLSVGVPGNIALAAKAHHRHGVLPWAELFDPAIALARDGFAMNRRLEASLASQPERADKTDYAQSVFFGSDGEPLPVGTRIVNPQLAATLEAIASQGPTAMYGEEAAEELAAFVAEATPVDGRMTTSDIAGYAAKTREPVCASYRAYTVCGMGPPSSGGIAVIQMLGQLERFDLAALGPDSPVFWHLFLESQRVAYADRALYIGDSDFVSVPTTGLIATEYLAERSRLIDPTRRLETVEPGRPEGAPLALVEGDRPEENGTSHFSVADAAGNVVSYTSTIEGAFGSGLVFGGYYLNNELTDFSFRPEADGKPIANAVAPGKRPRSSMAPTIVFDADGKAVLVIGAAGGPTIPVQVARSIIGVVDFGMSASEALAMPFIMSFGEAVALEEGTPLVDMEATFRALGHEQFRVVSPPLKANALLRTPTGWESADDPRIAPLLATE